MENVEPQNLSSPNGKRTDFKEEKSLSNAEALLALYTEDYLFSRQFMEDLAKIYRLKKHFPSFDNL